MENDPFAVIEAMTIAGVTTGSERGWIYIRGEYPLATHRLNHAIEHARASGYLGSKIAGSEHSFDIEVRRGAGAYICGEETALFNSIEGQRGEPRNKPPFPTTSGLFGEPTVINNPETLINVLEILNSGVDAYRSLGTDRSPGTKLFCLSGHIRFPGLYEVPFGVSLGELLQIAGGVVGDLQAILMGGAAGRFVGPEKLDLPLTLEDAAANETTLGSGALMVFVMSLGYYVTPALLGGAQNMMLPEFIIQQVQSFLNWGLASAAAALLVVITLVLFYLYLKLQPESPVSNAR